MAKAALPKRRPRCAGGSPPGFGCPYGLRHLKSEDRARDLVQAVLLAVLQAARGRRIENPEHLARYVLGTCRNVANRQRDVERRFTPTGESELDCESFVPELDVLATAALMRCMSRLDYRARTVMWLTFNEERPPIESPLLSRRHPATCASCAIAP